MIRQNRGLCHHEDRLSFNFARQTFYYLALGALGKLQIFDTAHEAGVNSTGRHNPLSMELGWLLTPVQCYTGMGRLIRNIYMH